MNRRVPLLLGLIVACGLTAAVCAREPELGEVDFIRRLWFISTGSVDEANVAGTTCAAPPQVLVWGEILILQDGRGVRALESSTGRPAWQVAPDDEGSLIDSGTFRRSGSEAFSESSLPGVIADSQWWGIVSGRLCGLDLQAEGKLIAARSADELANSREQRAHFVGGPVVTKSMVIVPLAHRPRSAVAEIVGCSISGEVRWRTAIPFDLVQPWPTPSTVPVAAGAAFEGVTYWNLAGSLVVALDAQTGRMIWKQLLPANDDSRMPTEGACDLLATGNQLFALSGESLMELLPESGKVLWRQELSVSPREIVGKTADLVIVSGSHLWGLAASTGAPRWWAGPAGWPEGMPRKGLLNKQTILWPTTDGIWMVDAERGRVLQRWHFPAFSGMTQGNLALAGNVLIVSGRQSVTAFSVRPASTAQ